MEALGVVVNPIAGMGGRVGLKGTDGKVAEARRRGAQPRAPERARAALRSLRNRDPDTAVYTAAGVMGERAARDAGFDPVVVYDPADSDDRTEADPARPSDPAEAETAATDTRRAVRAVLEHDVDLVLFVGGDGTAVDVAETLESVEGDADDRTPVLGVPAGVKIYSSVFAVTPEDAGRIAAEFDRVADREVNDIDEDAYREGEVRAELRAIVPVPVAEDVQSSKQLASGSVDSLAVGFAREVEPGRTYVFGPGSTVGAIEEELGLEPSPLGVDVWRAGDDGDGTLLARDAAEDEILEVLEEPVTIVVSPIGGQGFVFGRGNHQISPPVIRRADEIEIVASAEKLDGIDALHVDTDDDDLDEELRGWTRVRTGRFTTRLVNVA
ncbi:N-acetylglucosamine-1-phosphate uridyltransferase [Halobiforma lacisalsi AJ5]|uniref:ATP-NAD/AcoX kinase n=1 Tax=Natronobacterium lacisalsi AJ5 TaxID=358396 RepID=M0LVB9_NATLA|nr:ATP-NAD kinase family protein [Halobiforma lacisalsi]APW99802.1 N-acetylglucosamine-1-phosphate uridyltransferase [Halobiforma lacisalsi AJ5]EMA36020.1 ATP-NAD/AcoX kinase [Halobiforma lacisalsi AJ5]